MATMPESRFEAAGTAALLVALLAVPTASQSVEYPDERVSETPVISSETDTEIDVNIDPETVTTAEIERHNMVYRVEQTPSTRIEVLTSPQGVLKEIRTNRSRISKLETPYGTLKKGVKNGRRVSSFRGLNRSRAEELMQDLKESIEIYGSRVRQDMLPDIDARILRNRADDPSESIRIENNEDRSMDLSGWKLVNSDGDSYTFESLEVPAYGRATVFAAERSELNVSETNTSEYVYGTGIDWDQDEDEASLFNLRGVEVASDSY
jgi:hypothetical protein